MIYGSRSYGFRAIIAKKITPNIVLGADFSMTAQTVYVEDWTPRAFKNFEGATAYFPATGDTSYSVVGSLVNEDLGLVSFDVPASGTALFEAQDEASLQIDLEDDGKLYKLALTEVIDISAALY